ncbi:MAG: GGDEF domain-containing protein [bacterium]|nr:GGDEF domain-containing protein [bacterium]
MSEDATELTTRNLAKQTFLRRQKTIEQFKKESLTDELTGLYNRRGFNQKLDEYYSVAQRTGGVLRIVFIDADKFREINENFGYGIGDLALKAISKGVEKIFQRKTDAKARWGGDEFVVLSLDEPGSYFMEINKLSDRLNSTIGQSRSGKIPGEVPINVTLGIEVWNREDSIEGLVKKVEDHMKLRK